MAVSKMKLVNIIGQYKMLDETISACLDSGCYQPENTADLMENVEGFTHISEENPYTAALSKISDVLHASHIPLEVMPDDGTCFTISEVESYFDSLDKQLVVMQQERSELLKEQTEIQSSVEQLKHFFGLNIELEKVFSSQFLKVRFGRIPAESFEKLKTYTKNPYILFFPCSSDNSYYWGMYVAPLHEKESVDRIFQSLFFERLWITASSGTPEEAVESLKKRAEEIKLRLEELTALIETFISHEKEKCLKIYSQILRQHEAFDTRKYGAKRNDTFMQIGWVPENHTELITEKLDRVDGIDYQIEEPEMVKRASPPSLLKNSRIFKPFEFFVKMYGLPTYSEIDPTVFVAITYTLLFGIMFADVGQGLLLSVIGFGMYKFKNMPLGKILIPCGISGSIFGLVFGSVFGFENLLDPLYHALGFEEKPFEVMHSVNQILIFSVGLGVFLVVVAMLLNIVSSLKQKNLENALFGTNGIAGLSVYVSTLVLVILPMITDIKLPFLPILIIFIIIPLLAMFMREPLGGLVSGHKNWQPESWGGYLTQSFFEMFESLLSYVTNTVSFLRVGAFVLVHAGMMTTFIYLAELVGGGIGGAIMLIFGNALVIALEGLLVGIQVLRLEFYEMFSRFFEGGGRPFEPVVIKNKTV